MSFDQNNSRSEEIHKKGFDMINDTYSTEYGKIKVGLKTLDNAVLSLNGMAKSLSNRNYT